MMSAKMNICLHDTETKSVQTTTHAHNVERAITTVNDSLYRILDSLNQDKSECNKHADTIINNYNSTEHSITQIKPNEAVKPEKHYG